MALPSHQTAAIISEYNTDPNSFQIVNNYPIHSLSDYGVLVKNQYASINPIDYKVRKGAYPKVKTFPHILGVDASGTVVAVGSKVTKFKIGDEVSGPTLSSGTYQQYVSYVESELAHKPKSISHQIASAGGVIFLTTFQALQKFTTSTAGEQGSLKGRKVLIIGGSGGTGAAAVLLAKHYFEADLVVSVASLKNSDFVKSLGAGIVLDYTAGKEKLSQQLNEYVHSFDIVLDTIGGYNEYYGINVLKNSPQSVFVTIAGGLPTSGTVFGTENYSFLVMSATGSTYEKILNWLEKEGLANKIPITHVVKLENVSEAHKLIETQRTIGKIVLEISHQ